MLLIVSVIASSWHVSTLCVILMGSMAKDINRIVTDFEPMQSQCRCMWWQCMYAVQSEFACHVLIVHIHLSHSACECESDSLMYVSQCIIVLWWACVRLGRSDAVFRVHGAQYVYMQEYNFFLFITLHPLCYELSPTFPYYQKNTQNIENNQLEITKIPQIHKARDQSRWYRKWSRSCPTKGPSQTDSCAYTLETWHRPGVHPDYRKIFLLLWTQYWWPAFGCRSDERRVACLCLYKMLGDSICSCTFIFNF